MPYDEIATGMVREIEAHLPRGNSANRLSGGILNAIELLVEMSEVPYSEKALRLLTEALIAQLQAGDTETSAIESQLEQLLSHASHR